MNLNRRKWLRNTGLALLGTNFISSEVFAKNNSRNNFIQELPVHLNSNENPYGMSPKAVQAMVEVCSKSNRYNWDLAPKLIDALAKNNGVGKQNIILGAGSTEVLDLVSRYAGSEKGSFIMAQPTYPFWADTPINLGMRKIAVPLTADKKHDLAAMLFAIQNDTRLIYLCNPNNPTGTICERSELETFIKEASKKAIVLVDEAYIEFTDQQSLSNLVLENKNLVVARTFSKIYGMAGARMGYGIAHEDTIERISKSQSWVNGGISLTTLAAAIASVEDKDFASMTRKLIDEAKKYTAIELSKLGIRSIPSSTSFMYLSLENYQKEYFKLLKENQILGTGEYEKEGKWTRITMGTMQEMQYFIKALS